MDGGGGGGGAGSGAGCGAQSPFERVVRAAEVAALAEERDGGALPVRSDVDAVLDWCR